MKQDVIKEEQALQTKSTRRMLKPIEIVALVIGIALIVVLVYLAFFKNKGNTEGENIKNPILESYLAKLPELKQLAESDTTNTQYMRDYAIALYATGDIEGSKNYYEKELEINKEDPVLYNNAGNAYRDSGIYQKAVDSYQKSIDLDAHQTNAYNNLANMLIYTMNELEIGIGVYEKAISSNPENAEQFLISIASAYEQNNDKANAVKKYNEVLQLNQYNTVAKSALERLNK